MPCSCLSPCEVPSLVPVEVYSRAYESSRFDSGIQFYPIHVYGAADPLAMGGLPLFYALAVLLLLPFVLYRQRHSSWVLLNLVGLRAVSAVPLRPRGFRLVLSERERSLLHRFSEVARGARGATHFPKRMQEGVVPVCFLHTN